jgi:hypothetical protein
VYVVWDVSCMATSTDRSTSLDTDLWNSYLFLIALFIVSQRIVPNHTYSMVLLNFGTMFVGLSVHKTKQNKKPFMTKILSSYRRCSIYRSYVRTIFSVIGD